MTIPVRLTPRAERDIEEIGDFIARDSPAQATRFVVMLRQRCAAIGVLPNAAPRRPELGEGIRMVVYRGYLIFYALRDDAVVIERVLHGARDTPTA